MRERRQSRWARTIRKMRGLVLAVAVLTLASCETQQIPKAESPVHGSEAAKPDCGKFSPQIQSSLRTNGFVSQSLERLYYSSSLQSCVVVTYSIYPVNSPLGPPSGGIQVESRTFPSGRILFSQNYPLYSGHTKAEILVDVNRQLRENGWED